MSHPDTISIHRSFVVWFYPGVNLDGGEISGWVEHVVSGETKEFRCAVSASARRGRFPGGHGTKLVCGDRV